MQLIKKEEHKLMISNYVGTATEQSDAGEGCYQRGLRITDLFVSIMSVGSFGFKTDSTKDVGYIAEKLFNSRVDDSVKAVTDLINGIIKELEV